MFAVLAPLLAFATSVAAQALSDDSALVSQLLTANSQVSRISDIANDTAFVFDFLNGSRGTAAGGFAVLANSGNFPALLTGRGAMAVGVMGPCGANSPHTHPRATEIQLVVQGGPIYTQFVMENGARVVSNTVSIGSATIFPKGSMHFQQNLGCEPTIFVASFDNVDPGTMQIAQNFFSLNQGVVNATLGDLGASVLDHLALPENFIVGAQSCLDSCGIDRSTFNFSASFKDYAIFSNSTWGRPPALSSSVLSQYASPTSTSNGLFGDSSDLSGLTDIPFVQNPLHAAVIGLAVATSALVLALVILLTLMARQRLAGNKTSHKLTSIFGASRYPLAAPNENADVFISKQMEQKS